MKKAAAHQHFAQIECMWDVSARLTSHFYYSTVRALCWSSPYNDADDNVMMPATGDRQIVRHSEEKKLCSNTKQLEPNKEETILIFIDSYLPHWMEIKLGEWVKRRKVWIEKSLPLLSVIMWATNCGNDSEISALAAQASHLSYTHF